MVKLRILYVPDQNNEASLFLFSYKNTSCKPSNAPVILEGPPSSSRALICTVDE